MKNMMKRKIQHQLRIRKDGMIEFLSPPPFPVYIKHQARWSEIVPCNPILEFLFRLLRRIFGDNGLAAAFTRIWKCRWRMTVLSTGYTEENWNRQVLIDREHELYFKPKGDWLN